MLAVYVKVMLKLYRIIVKYWVFVHSVLFDNARDLPPDLTWREFIIQNVTMHKILTIILYNLNVILANSSMIAADNNTVCTSFIIL